MKKHKTIPYGHHWIDAKDIEGVVKVLKSPWITQGPKVQEFEKALCKYTGAKYAVCVSSATSGLHLACLAGGITQGDEVITSPMTFVATSNSIIYSGGKPIFADIQEDTINIDPLEIKKKITSKTKAIIPVHFAGHPCDLKEIYEIGRKNHLMIIEDASHALGAIYRGEKIGSCKYSDMTVFSFHPVKAITTGEGGAVLTNKEDLYEKLLLLRNHGITKNRENFVNFNPRADGEWYYEMHSLGFNFRISDFQCALGISQLKKLDNFIKKRREIVKKYNLALSKLPHYQLPVEKKDVKSAWHIYYIKVKNAKRRLKLFNRLRELGISVQVHYIPVYLQPYYQKNFNKGLCPRAENYYQQTITIPLYPRMTNEEINYVSAVLRSNYD